MAVDADNFNDGDILGDAELKALGLSQQEMQAIAGGQAINPEFLRGQGDVKQITEQLLRKQLASRIQHQSQSQKNIQGIKNLDDLDGNQQAKAMELFAQLMETIQGQAKQAQAATSATSNTSTSSAPIAQPTQPVQSTAASFQFDPSKVITEDSIPEPEVKPLRVNSNPSVVREPDVTVNIIEDEKEPGTDAQDESTNKDKPFCPQCLWDLELEVDKPSSTDIMLFKQAAVTGRPFSKTFDIYGGDLQVTFRTRPFMVHKLVEQQLKWELDAGELPTAPYAVALASYQHRQRQLQLVASVCDVGHHIVDHPEFNSEEWRSRFPADLDNKRNTLAVAFDSVFGGWGDILYASVYKQFSRFELLTARLMEASGSPDFYRKTASHT